MSDVSDSLDAFARWAKSIERRLNLHAEWHKDVEERVAELERQAKPVTVFTARAGETFAIKCEIPSCEVCAAQGVKQ